MIECDVPFPRLIPRPLIDDREKFKAMGIDLDIDQCEHLCRFVEYQLPRGWKVVDKSVTIEDPNFYFVDSDGNNRVRFHGFWIDDISWGQFDIDFL